MSKAPLDPDYGIGSLTIEFHGLEADVEDLAELAVDGGRDGGGGERVGEFLDGLEDVDGGAVVQKEVVRDAADAGAAVEGEKGVVGREEEEQLLEEHGGVLEVYSGDLRDGCVRGGWASEGGEDGGRAWGKPPSMPLLSAVMFSQ